jgi:hypothetical protein
MRLDLLSRLNGFRAAINDDPALVNELFPVKAEKPRDGPQKAPETRTEALARKLGAKAEAAPEAKPEAAEATYEVRSKYAQPPLYSEWEPGSDG